MKPSKFKFVDLFAGIGGFHFGLSKIGGKCVLASEIDPVAAASYSKNFPISPLGDINEIKSSMIPDFDVLCAGFPCQSFSHIGPGGGLKDPRGATIYQVFRVLKDKQPKAFILENVKGLVSFNGGVAFKYILTRLKRLGYKVKHDILEAKDYGLPQIRKRLFIVGTRKDYCIDYQFPKPLELKKKLNDVMRGSTEREYAFTIRCGGRNSGINNRFNWDRYIVDGMEREITVHECLELQGFPRKYYLAGGKEKQLKLIGNSVPTTIVREIGRKLLESDIFSS